MPSQPTCRCSRPPVRLAINLKTAQGLVSPSRRPPRPRERGDQMSNSPNRGGRGGAEGEMSPYSVARPLRASLRSRQGPLARDVCPADEVIDKDGDISSRNPGSAAFRARRCFANVHNSGLESTSIYRWPITVKQLRRFHSFDPWGLWANYKPEFELSLNVNAETSWGRAAQRFTDTVRYRTGGRIRITCLHDAQLLKGEQLSEFELLRKGSADFSVGSTINWSPQVKELNLFAMPFLTSTYAQVDAVQAWSAWRAHFCDD